MHIGVAHDAAHVAERLLHRLAEHDAGVFGGVVLVDVQVALGLQLDVDPGVARQELEHVVEEADAGRDLGAAGAVEVQLDGDLGLLGGAGDLARAHRELLEIAPPSTSKISPAPQAAAAGSGYGLRNAREHLDKRMLE